ncbi:signal peptidase I [Nocardioides sp. HDW12B]|uniref:Ig-like domain-containing protein n=1 Tax=Nocardioides sp. HDW12B TaxID=2714939 RepID=UPI00140ADFEA|nr:Ig-like domain-containing protein [Nocardioides sp. HDW12B]QIK67257.1 signal peptidase I [Nocardioides sp. HDW12B]
MSRPVALLVLALTAGLVLLGMPSFSGATYVSTTRNTLSTVTAASDWTPPTVSVRNPGSSVKDTATITADATDGETGIAQVVVQYLPENGTWTTICTTTAAPYSCSWNTTTLADGPYELRAVATDGAGYTTTSASVTTTVANKLVATLASPGDVVKGSVALNAAVFGAGTLTYKVDVEYALADTTKWTPISNCTQLVSPYTCAWNTTGFANVGYDLRAVATSGASKATSALVSDVLVDNVAPSVTMTDPGSPLRGTVTFGATATDAESGVASVVLQYAATGTSTWKELCTVTTAPYSCRFDTVGIADGSYAVRAVVTDVAGNPTTSAVVANRVVDNTVSSVSLNDPGTYLSGTVNLTAVANSTAGVTSVRIERAAAGSSTWTEICTDTTAPYSCSWSTTTVADGGYQLRAVLVDGSSRTTTSSVVSGLVVDNSPLRGADVQTVNGGAISGRLDSGDVIRLTYSDQANLSTLSAGWNGSALGVVVRVRDGNPLGLGNKGDTLDVLRTAGGAVVPLGSVRLNEDYVKSNRTAQLNATMTATSVTVNGVPVTQVTLTLGSLAGNTVTKWLRTVTLTSAMQWTPSATATDLSGRPASVAPATETGALDREF